MKIAQFKDLRFGLIVASATDVSGRDFVRISEWVEVDFPSIETNEIEVLEKNLIEKQESCQKECEEIREKIEKLKGG